MFFEKNNNFDEIRGDLLILLFFRAQTRASKGPLRKNHTELEVEALDTPNFLKICVI